MPTQAVQHVKRMRGGAQGHLMRCDDGHYYVVKFRNNPQHERVLANEFLATRLAERVGLPVPAAEVVEVQPWLVEHTAELTIVLGSHAIQVEAGLQFGSRYVVSPVEGKCLITCPRRCWSGCGIWGRLQESWRWINGLATPMGGRRRSGGRCGRKSTRRRSSIKGIALMRESGRFRIFLCAVFILGMRFMRG